MNQGKSTSNTKLISGYIVNVPIEGHTPCIPHRLTQFLTKVLQCHLLGFAQTQCIPAKEHAAADIQGKYVESRECQGYHKNEIGFQYTNAQRRKL